MDTHQAQNNQKRGRGRPRKPLTQVLSPEQQKILFKSKLVEYGTISKACQESGLARSTLYGMMQNGAISREEIEDCLLQHVDGTLDVAIEWAHRGIPNYLRDSHGVLLTDSSGNPIVEYRPSEKLLLKLLERHPEFKRSVGDGMHNGYHTSVQSSVFIVEADRPTDISNTVLHVKLADYNETGRQIILAAFQAAERYKTPG